MPPCTCEGWDNPGGQSSLSNLFEPESFCWFFSAYTRQSSLQALRDSPVSASHVLLEVPGLQILSVQS